MYIGTRSEEPSTKEQEIHFAPQDFFPTFLRRAQNSDGGWGHHPGSESAVEPTACSILGLCAHEEAKSKMLNSACQWLQRMQLADGAWPTSSGRDPGCWTTALACLAVLRVSAPSNDAITRGLKWLCATWPAEGSFFWRLRNFWRRNSQSPVRQNYSLRGWSWTPDTASWVEPTAYSMILLQNIPGQLLPAEATKRMQLGERMLYDRACPGGGWNAGNPLVYGVSGIPTVGPTVWALLALRHNKEHEVNVKSLEWLEEIYGRIPSPAALALAHLCLKVYGRPAAPVEPKLREFYQHNKFLQSVPAIAWAALALCGVPDWLGSPSLADGNL